MPREQGIALIAVLWVTVLLAALAAGMLETTRTEGQLARNLLESAKAEALADAGVYRAIAALMQQARSQSRSAVETPHSLSLGDGEIDIVVEHEGGKIDLNVADDELLEGLFRVAGLDLDVASALTATVADFRDSDQLSRLNGAEDEDYTLAGLPHGAKDAPFEVIEELQQVLGVTPELYHRVAPFITVHSWQRGINPFTAPREVISALPGIAPEDVDAFIGARDADQALLHPEAFARLRAAPVDADPILFAAASSHERSLQKRPQRRKDPAGLAHELGQEQSLERFITVERDPIYTIRAVARTVGGGVFIREAIVALRGQGSVSEAYRIYSWKHRMRPSTFDEWEPNAREQDLVSPGRATRRSGGG